MKSHRSVTISCLIDITMNDGSMQNLIFSGGHTLPCLFKKIIPKYT